MRQLLASSLMSFVAAKTGSVEDVVLDGIVAENVGLDFPAVIAEHGIEVFRLQQLFDRMASGELPVERNIISGNGQAGVRIENIGARGNRVLGNFIGTDRTGTSARPYANGVSLNDARTNVIGGVTAPSKR